MSITLSQRSKDRLAGAHPDLAKVIERAAAISDLDFTVLEVLRTVERQRELVAKGASRTMNSRHLPGKDGKSRAVDIAPMIGGQVSWDWPLYRKLAPIIKQAAADVGVPIEWGGDWRSFKDGPHWQLPFGKYP
ncbi:M15 family metallopeptidase [Novosphingobium sp. MMS21-SN21R]|uniref:M15 family metallopeptidase n=1 Tax=Novosphingobium sp. MMS21-SN21R TaxID=2969298 RepID=UPI002883E1B6|nr:M15 family metallopeptidase [Novosphingobium sp. MMS21-SN21R]MDT0507544.1 M15 family metallopeptidase [Novosphingobium sp. MMS21-SN21R]MDT0509521.1 M15 family metallopeptidase [Novosphingobium sp. MMS21-SN21R]